MIKLRILLVLVMISVSSSVLASKATINVLGMVCDFCATAIVDVFKQNSKVEKTTYSLDDKTITILIKDGKTITDEELRDLVEKSGYELTKITRHE